MSNQSRTSLSKCFSVIHVLVGLALIPACLVAQYPSGLTCYNKRFIGLNADHCNRALRTIVYDSTGRLDDRSRGVFVWYKTCVINVQKPQWSQPNRQWIESRAQAIAQTCRSSGGTRTYPEGVTLRIYRSTSTNVYSVNQPMCKPRRCNYQPDDCWTALKQLPVDHKGTFIVQDAALSLSRATHRNCTVTMRTTDSSGFRTSHPEINPSFKRMVHECGSHPGRIYISGGTAGNNGDVVISTRGPSC